MKKTTELLSVYPTMQVSEIWHYKDMTIQTEEDGRTATDVEMKKMLPEIKRRLKKISRDDYVSAHIDISIYDEKRCYLHFGCWFYRGTEKDMELYSEKQPNTIHIQVKKETEFDVNVNIELMPIPNERYEDEMDKISNFLSTYTLSDKHIKKIERCLSNEGTAGQGEIFGGKYGVTYSWNI